MNNTVEHELACAQEFILDILSEAIGQANASMQYHNLSKASIVGTNYNEVAKELDKYLKLLGVSYEVKQSLEVKDLNNGEDDGKVVVKHYFFLTESFERLVTSNMEHMAFFSFVNAASEDAIKAIQKDGTLPSYTKNPFIADSQLSCCHYENKSFGGMFENPAIVAADHTVELIALGYDIAEVTRSVQSISFNQNKAKPSTISSSQTTKKTSNNWIIGMAIIGALTLIIAKLNGA